MNTSALILGGLLLAGPLAGAASPDKAYGLKVDVIRPVGTFNNDEHLGGRTGYGVGGFMTLDFGGGHVLRPRVDYRLFSRGLGEGTYDHSQVSAMADYLYYLEGSRKGVYLTAGIGLQSTRREISGDSGPLHVSLSKNSTGLAVQAGAGYVLHKQWALELTFQTAKVGNWEVEGLNLMPSFNANSIAFSCSYTF